MLYRFLNVYIMNELERGMVMAAQAFHRLRRQTVYLLNVSESRFLYISDMDIFPEGCTEEEMMELGFEAYMRYVDEEDKAVLRKLFSAIDSLYFNTPAEWRSRFMIYINYHHMTKRKQDMVGHILTVVGDGLVMGTVAPSIFSTQKSLLAGVYGEDYVYEYNVAAEKWCQVPSVLLDGNMREVLRLSAQGCDVGEIARNMNRSKDTVKKYRKQLFDILGVESIEAAVAMVNYYGML